MGTRTQTFEIGHPDDVIVIRCGEDDARVLGALQLGAGAAVTPQEFLEELANTVAGHLKIRLGDGMVTGLPLYHENDPGQGGGFSCAFRAPGGQVLEVSSRG